MNPTDMLRLALFNYMIGNTDWAVPGQHNVKLIKSLQVLSDKGIPVAYDFDYSGFVNTVYSVPVEELPIKSVMERYYLGVCAGEDGVNTVIQEFGGLKEQFLTTVSECDYLSNTARKYVDSYINGFYKLYNYKNYLKNDMNRTCKQF
jgi:hypothetical protein